jgi:FKBP-type peptidyl-prolyl cis-trans isomerase
MMNPKIFAVVAAAGLLGALGACNDFTGGTTVTCRTPAPTIASAQGDTTTLNVGVRYIDTKVGTGGTAEICQAATIHYSLRVLGKDTAFDSSVGRQPLSFVAGTAVLTAVGVELGVPGMKVGGTRRLFIPPSLAYGDVDRYDSTGKILIVPAGSTIVADVELVSIAPLTN